MEITRPRTQTAEVLYELLTSKQTTRRDFFNRTGILSVTSRITELRKLGLNILCEWQDAKNKHDRPIRFGAWSLPETEKEKAREIYRTINQ